MRTLEVSHVKITWVILQSEINDGCFPLDRERLPPRSSDMIPATPTTPDFESCQIHQSNPHTNQPQYTSPEAIGAEMPSDAPKLHIHLPSAEKYRTLELLSQVYCYPNN